MTDPTPHPLAKYFQPSYQASRLQLLASLRSLAPRLGVTIDSRALVERGPSGETLALDFCIVGAAKPRHALLISSGTHGVEGFTGSAVQQWIAQTLLPTLQLAPHTAIILQHANNPYGFAWHRRVNEANVDINRNFLLHYDPALCEPGYEALLENINPTQWDQDSEAANSIAFAQFTEAHGFRALQQALSAGQYKYPKGIQFGGSSEQQSTRHLRHLFRQHLSACETLIWLDFHTGLGEFAACELITGAMPDTDNYRFSNQIWSQGVKSAQSGESVSAKLNGLLDQGLLAELPTTCKRAFAFPEYGTYPPTQVLNTMRADNWLEQHGEPRNLNNPRTAAIKKEILEAFKPDSREWEHCIVEHGAGLVREALAYLPGVK
jgi:predicted deacylase